MSEKVLDSEFHSENFWFLNFIVESKLNFENAYYRIKFLDIRQRKIDSNSGSSLFKSDMLTTKLLISIAM